MRFTQIAILALLIALFVGLASHWLEDGSVNRTVLKRIPSPDGRRTAVVTEVDGGATVSFVYSVTIEPGAKEALMVYAGTVGGQYGIETNWLDAHSLQVSFDHARLIRKGTVEDLNVQTKGKFDLPQ